MDLRYFTSIGAEYKRFGKLTDIMNQLYLYKLAPGEVLADIYTAGFFNQASQYFQDQDILFVSSPGDIRYITHIVSKSYEGEISITLALSDAVSIGIDNSNLLPIFQGGNLQEVIENINNNVGNLDTRTELKALDTDNYRLVFLLESGRQGFFRWTLGDFSTEVAADGNEGIYIKADAVDATVGAWIRQYTGPQHASWFDVPQDGIYLVNQRINLGNYTETVWFNNDFWANSDSIFYRSNGVNSPILFSRSNVVAIEGDQIFFGNNGNQFKIGAVLNAVNYPVAYGSATTGACGIVAEGTDLNVNLSLSSQNDGGVIIPGKRFNLGEYTGSSFFNYDLWTNNNNLFFRSNGVNSPILFSRSNIVQIEGNQTFFGNNGNQFKIGAVADSVNYVVSFGSATTGAPGLMAEGTDLNVNLSLSSQNDGGVIIPGKRFNLGEYTGAAFFNYDLWTNSNNLYFRSADVTRRVLFDTDSLASNMVNITGAGAIPVSSFFIGASIGGETIVADQDYLVNFDGTDTPIYENGFLNDIGVSVNSTAIVSAGDPTTVTATSGTPFASGAADWIGRWIAVVGVGTLTVTGWTSSTVLTAKMNYLSGTAAAQTGVFCGASIQSRWASSNYIAKIDSLGKLSIKDTAGNIAEYLNDVNIPDYSSNIQRIGWYINGVREFNGLGDTTVNSYTSGWIKIHKDGSLKFAGQTYSVPSSGTVILEVPMLNSDYAITSGQLSSSTNSVSIEFNKGTEVFIWETQGTAGPVNGLVHNFVLEGKCTL